MMDRRLPFCLLLLAAVLLLARPALAQEVQLAASDIAAALPAALGLVERADSESTARLDNPYLALAGSPGATLDFADLSIDPATSRFSGFALLRNGERIEVRQPVNGRIITRIEVPVLTRNLRRGEIIRAEDLSWQSMEVTPASQNVLHNAADVIGQTPRTSLRAGAPLREADLMAPAIISRGSLVTMVYRSGTLQLTARGRALGDAALGDTVRVASLSGSRTVEGVATSDGVVRIGGDLTN